MSESSEAIGKLLIEIGLFLVIGGILVPIIAPLTSEVWHLTGLSFSCFYPFIILGIILIIIGAILSLYE